MSTIFSFLLKKIQSTGTNVSAKARRHALSIRVTNLISFCNARIYTIKNVRTKVQLSSLLSFWTTSCWTEKSWKLNKNMCIEFHHSSAFSFWTKRCWTEEHKLILFSNMAKLSVILYISNCKTSWSACLEGHRRF